MVKISSMLLAGMTLAAQTYTFSDGGKPTRVEFAADEVYLAAKSNAARKATIEKVKGRLGRQVKAVAVAEAGGSGFVVRLSGPARDAVKKVRGQGGVAEVESAAPVFYDSSDNASARRESARRILTNRLLVRMNDGQWRALQTATAAQSQKESPIDGWALVEYRDPYAALDAVEWLTKDGGWEFSPVFARQFSRRQASGTLKRTVNDPLYGNQWHLANDGPGIHMNASWDFSTGKGINVAVVDDGMDVRHEDLAGNAYAVSSGNHHNFNSGPPDDPTPAAPDQNHGTSCAGLIAAVGFNNIGVIGVAPEARLMGLRLIAEPSGDDAVAGALSWQPNGLVTHVSSNSWGPQDDGMDPGRMGSLQAAAIEKAATTYRSGLGTVFAVSAGNGRQSGDDSSFDEFAGSRFVIAVGAVNQKGEPSSYSEAGINVAISALGGEFAPPEMVWTTNNSGQAALDALKSKFDTTQAPVNYSDAFNGTSAAAPQVSGAAALLLQANPNLGYRDVKEIFMKTATKDGLQNGDDFKDNGGGFSFSHSFGAGLLNVSAALDLAAGWKNLGPLTSISATATGSAPIPDGSVDGVTATFDFSGTSNLRVESVELTVNIKHANRGDVGLLITSPSGMVSIVNNRPGDTGRDFPSYKFTSVRHWGENSSGKWTVRVIDIVANGVAGTTGDMTMRIWGTAK